MEIVARMQYDVRVKVDSDLDFSHDKGLTKQSDAKDCDINAMFKRYERTGQLPEMIVRQPRYGDFSDVPTYQEALDIVRMAQEQFDALDVNVRNRFENDPAKFLAFVTDDKNYDEAVKMGLIKPEIVAAKQKAAAEAEAKAVADAKAKGPAVAGGQ